ncbi:ABC-2 family transporter protein [Candidatus Woesebacteria bacterium]|nr:ABC-2 family transporter protein [Candidatus Woesebacteria bacterium]
MNKYLQIFKISFEQEFVYRLNFIMWRVRNVLQIFLIFFLWDTVFSDPGRTLFGYDRAKILTYVFGILIVKALVLSARAVDVAGDIARGDLSNYLLKPISYFKYWFTRDISSKALNIIFAAVEFVLLYLVLKPPFFFQTNPQTLIIFLLAIAVAVFIYFNLLFIVSTIPFWAPELGWGGHFLVTVIIVEFLSGALFPTNILPANVQSIVLLTPFPYLIYFPVEVYLGNITGAAMIKGFYVGLVWVFALWVFMKYLWQKGLKVYESVGR